jgi:hypothetical protein
MAVGVMPPSQLLRQFVGYPRPHVTVLFLKEIRTGRMEIRHYGQDARCRYSSAAPKWASTRVTRIMPFVISDTNPNPALAGCQAALDRIVEALVMGGKIALPQDRIV